MFVSGDISLLALDSYLTLALIRIKANNISYEEKLITE